MNEFKYKKYVLIWGIVLIILQSFTLISIVSNTSAYSLVKNIALYVAIMMLVILVLFLVLSLKKIKAGPIIGIIAGVLYILNFSLLNIAIGICFIVSCVDMLKELKSCK